MINVRVNAQPQSYKKCIFKQFLFLPDWQRLKYLLVPSAAI